MMPSQSQTQEPFWQQFGKLTAINILSNVMVPIAGLLDMAFLGHLTEIRHLAGVALATVLFNYLYWTFGFLRMSTTGMTAQAIGREDEAAAVLIGLRHLLLALLIGLVLLGLQVPIRWVGFALLQAQAEVKLSGQAFYAALIWGAPATLMNFVIVGWFLGRSQSDRVLLLTIVNCSANVLLDYLLIVRWGWESAGAGLATALSQWLMLGVGLILLRQEVAWAQVRAIAPLLWNLADLRATFRLNREILIRTFALISTFAVFTNLGAGLGTEILTANAVLLQGVTLAAYLIDGLAFATESLAGLSQGQGAVAQLQRLVWAGCGVSLLIGLGFAIGVTWQSDRVFGWLTSHRETVGQAHEYVRWLVPVLGLGSIAYLLDGYFIGLTQGGVLRRSTVLAAVAFGPVAIGAVYFHSNHGLWLALSVFMAVRALSLGLAVPKTWV